MSIRNVLWLLLALSAIFLIYVNAATIVASADAHNGLAAWVQGFGTILALTIAIAVPWIIHKRELRAAAAPRLRNRALLDNALTEAKGALDGLILAGNNYLIEHDGEPPPITNINAPNIGADIEETLRSLMGSVAILNTIMARDDIDDYAVLRPLMALKERLEHASPILIREINILTRHKTPGTVHFAIATSSTIAEDLTVWIDQARNALQA